MRQYVLTREKRLLAVCVVLALSVTVGVARATTIPVSAGVSWDIENDCGQVDDGGPDAYDDFGYLEVGGSDACSLNLTLSGSTHTTTTPTVKSGLTVTRTLVASGHLLTYTDVLTNTGGAPISAVVRFGGNLGSDGLTAVGGTSSGDLTLTPADTWVVTYENWPGGAGDPVVGFARLSATNATFVRWETGSVGVTWAPADDEPYARYDVTVPAGGSATLVHRLYIGDYNASWVGPQPAQIAAAIAALTVTADVRAGYCTVAGNTNPNTGKAFAPGSFVDLSISQPASDPSFKGALPANYLQGLGISCDVPAGYTKTSEKVGYAGSGSAGIYDYYRKG